MVLNQRLLLSKWDSLKFNQLEQGTIPTCKKCGIRNECGLSEFFCAGTITKTFSQHWRLCRKWWRFITTKTLICPNLDLFYLTLPTFVCAVLPVQSFLFTEGIKDLLSKLREALLGGPSIVFTRRAVVDEIHIRKSSNVCKSIVAIDAGQLNPYSMCQPMVKGPYSRYNFYADLQILRPRQNRSLTFENMVMSYFQPIR